MCVDSTLIMLFRRVVCRSSRSAAAAVATGRSSRVGAATTTAAAGAYGSVRPGAHYTCNDDTLSTASTSDSGVPDHRGINGVGGNPPTVFNGAEAPAVAAASGGEVVLMEKVVYRQLLSDIDGYKSLLLQLQRQLTNQVGKVL
jgi:hypothetical protein